MHAHSGCQPQHPGAQPTSVWPFAQAPPTANSARLEPPPAHLEMRAVNRTFRPEEAAYVTGRARMAPAGGPLPLCSGGPYANPEHFRSEHREHSKVEASPAQA